LQFVWYNLLIEILGGNTMNCKKFLVGAFALAMCFGVVSTFPVENISNGVVASAEDSVEPTSSIYFDFRYNDDEMTATVSGYKSSGPTDVVIPSTVTVTNSDGTEKVYTVTTLGNYAFNGNTYITSVVIPDTVILMDGYNTFAGCKSLKSVTLGSSLRNISTKAFLNCTSLTSINIPDSVTTIYEEAFNGCTSLESITIPDSVVSIGNTVFGNCISLKEATLSNNIAEIPQSIFEGCTALESVNIPNGVTLISNGAFRNCDALKRLTIPYSVNTINLYAFEKTELTDIYYTGTEDDWNDIYFTGSGSLDGVTMHYNATGDEEGEEPIVSEYVRGDVTDDGKVDVLDLLKIKKYILGIIDNLY
jgi:hypothetical protein